MTLFDDSNFVVFAECDDDRAAQVAHEECPGRTAGLVCTCRCHEEDDLQPEPPW
ncbi:hypothetical protein OS965_37190 [Streptomyces sp. H27-G5]|uniref:hypothetical protein n=1 Tax=Streptomyces sp. H27-G5 TaxID=2996698 RepID=UPI00226F843B|nr:hypothetical protein [Streptomyces sp. H27-G5]MCY0923717.1 hypothetical protein [Streptomyces sp. H27-G5]